MRACLALVLALVGCDPSGPSVEQVGRAQPGASVLPLQSANLVPPDGGIPVLSDAGAASDASPPAPKPFEAYDKPKPDRLSRELDGIKLKARWRWREDGPWPEPPDGLQKTFERLREATSPVWHFDMAAAGRMRAEVIGRGQPLPKGSSLMMRTDRYGSVLVWPTSYRYRVLPPGTLRNTMGDRRADLSPLTAGKMTLGGASERLGMTTRKVELSSSAAKIELELAQIEGAGLGGPLLCRMLLEIAGMEPGSEACQPAEVALRARITWAGPDGDDGGIELDVFEVLAEQKLSGRRMASPPAQARFVKTGLPGPGQAVFLSETELAEMRKEETPPTDVQPGVVTQGLQASNRTDRLLYLVIDGIVVASIPPWQTIDLPKLKSAAYTVQWRSFLGERTAPSAAVDAPSRVSFGAPEPEKPDAG